MLIMTRYPHWLSIILAASPFMNPSTPCLFLSSETQYVSPLCSLYQSLSSCVRMYCDSLSRGSFMRQHSSRNAGVTGGRTILKNPSGSAPMIPILRSTPHACARAACSVSSAASMFTGILRHPGLFNTPSLLYVSVSGVPTKTMGMRRSQRNAHEFHIATSAMPNSPFR